MPLLKNNKFSNVLFPVIIIMAGVWMYIDGEYVKTFLIVFFTVLTYILRNLPYLNVISKYITLGLAFQFTQNLFVSQLIPFFTYKDLSVTLPAFLTLLIIITLLSDLKSYKDVSVLMKRQNLFFRSFRLFITLNFVLIIVLLFSGYFTNTNFSLAGKILQYFILFIWVLFITPVPTTVPKPIRF